MLTKELAKHRGGPDARWEEEGGGSEIRLRVAFSAWSALNPVMEGGTGALTTEIWNCHGSPESKMYS